MIVSQAKPQLSRDSLIKLYRAAGFSVIPLAPGCKSPPAGFPLQRFIDGEAQLSDEEVKQYFTDPEMNVGVILGEPSNGLTVFDFEYDRDAFDFWPNLVDLSKETIVVSTPHGGYHLWLKSVEHIGRHTKVSSDHPFDLLGTGYIVAPPSKVNHIKCDLKKERCPHTGETNYTILDSYRIGDKFQTVSSIVDSTVKRCKTLGWKTTPIRGRKLTLSRFKQIMDEIQEGGRSDSAVLYARFLLLKQDNWGAGLDNVTAWHEIQRWNEQCCNPPLEEKELLQCFTWAEHIIAQKPDHGLKQVHTWGDKDTTS